MCDMAWNMAERMFGYSESRMGLEEGRALVEASREARGDHTVLRILVLLLRFAFACVGNLCHRGPVGC
jgi:hypothetical protein